MKIIKELVLWLFNNWVEGHIIMGEIEVDRWRWENWE